MSSSKRTLTGDTLCASYKTHRPAVVVRAGERAFGLQVAELQLTEERGLAGQGAVAKLISQLARSGSVFIPVFLPDAIFGVTR